MSTHSTTDTEKDNSPGLGESEELYDGLIKMIGVVIKIIDETLAENTERDKAQLRSMRLQNEEHKQALNRQKMVQMNDRPRRNISYKQPRQNRQTYQLKNKVPIQNFNVHKQKARKK